MRTPLVIVLFAVGCGAPRQQTVHREPRSWAEHESVAERHDRLAAQHERAHAQAVARRGSPESPAAYTCGDVVLNDQLRSGGERLTAWMPCWDINEEAVYRHERRAREERRAAAGERQQGEALVRAELAACKGIPDRELSHPVFAHTREIAEVIPHRESGAIRGVRIVFKPVLGLTAGWVAQSIRCQQARAVALGRPEMPNDPSLIAGAEITVSEHDGQVEVLVTTPSDVDARIALNRAQDLVRERTATR